MQHSSTAHSRSNAMPLGPSSQTAALPWKYNVSQTLKPIELAVRLCRCGMPRNRSELVFETHRRRRLDGVHPQARQAAAAGCAAAAAAAGDGGSCRMLKAISRAVDAAAAGAAAGCAEAGGVCRSRLPLPRRRCQQGLRRRTRR